jgi:prepilin-type N-terminal cleavage/methylation domain-containing protein
MQSIRKACKIKAGFTVLELMVAVAVTALLAAVLLNVSTQVLETQRIASGDLETNQIAQFALDRIQEDLQCALYRNDGNVWMAISILETKDNSGSWIPVDESEEERGKPIEDSFRILSTDWPDDEKLPDEEIDWLGQSPFEKSRFGVGGTWLRFFTQGPELDQKTKNTGAARAVAYQIIRHGLTPSPTSSVRYQLFRSDVSAKNTFEAGYNLYPKENAYSIDAAANDPSTPRVPSTITNPIIPEGSDYSSTAFSLAANVIDFGVRAYVLEKNSFGTGNLVQIFPAVESGNLLATEYLATSNSNPELGYQTLENPPYHLFPDVIDLFIRVLTNEGARLLESLENGLIPTNDQQNWWTIAEEHSEVYVRRVKIYGQGL